MGEIADSIIDGMIDRACGLPSFSSPRRTNRDSSALFSFNLYVYKETDKAILIENGNFNEKTMDECFKEIWIPKSMVEFTEMKENNFCDIKIPRWLCEKHCLFG